MSVFTKETKQKFAELYPDRSGVIEHNLNNNDLFSLEPLAQLAERTPIEKIEYSRGDNPLTVDPDKPNDNGLTPAQTIRSIEDNASWLVIKNIEQDAAYSDFLNAMIDELQPIIERATGPIYRRQCFVFVTSPGSITPFHMDPEHNILLQIKGSKTMNAYPANDDSIVRPELHEAYHGGGHRNLVHDPAYDEKMTAHHLTPGKGVAMPVKAPHWVQNGDAVSISLSITWRSKYSVREANVQCMNHFLRQKGLNPTPPGVNPLLDQTKAFGWRVIDKIGLAGRA